MRFPFVSIALLALSHSVIPGVHGAPMVASDSLAVRQASLIDGLLSTITSILQGVLPGDLSLAEVQQITQAVESSLHAANPVLPRADSTSLVSMTTTSRVSAASTTQTGTSIVGSVSSVSLSTPRASSTPIRTRRQLPTSLLPKVTSSLGALESVLPTSVPLSVPSKPGSETSKAVTSKSTMSNPSAPTSRG